MLSAQEQQELAMLESELSNRQGQTGQQQTPEEIELAQIEQELASRQQGLQENSMAQVNQGREAELGFIDRARYAIEPLQANRGAFLIQQYGQDNVRQNAQGDYFLRQKGEWRPVNKQGFSIADVADIAGALPESIGGAIGGAIGLGTGGVGVIPSAVAGGALGSVARQGISTLIGNPQVAGIEERAIETGLSAGLSGAGAGLAVGVKKASPYIKQGFSKIGDWLSSGASKQAQQAVQQVQPPPSTSKQIVDSFKKQFSFTKADDASEFLKIADDLGIDREILPEAVEYGQRSLPSRLGRVITEGPLGEKRFNDFVKIENQISNKLDDAITKISDYIPPTDAEAGEYIVNSINNFKKEFIGSLDETYNNVLKADPKAMLSDRAVKNINRKLKQVENFANDRIFKGIGEQRAQAKTLLKDIQSIKNSDGSLRDTLNSLRNIGEEAFKTPKFGEKIPVDQKRLQEIYFSLQDEIMNSVEDRFGKQTAKALRENNKMISDFLQNESQIKKSLSLSPDKVYQSLVKNPDINRLKAMKAIMKPSEFDSVKASVLDSIIERNNEGLVNHVKSINNLKKLEAKGLLKEFFSPEELQPIRDILKFRQRMGEPVMSSSATGASNAFREFMDRAKSSVINEQTLNFGKRMADKKAQNAIKPKIKGPSKITPSRLGKALNIVTDEKQREISRERK